MPHPHSKCASFVQTLRRNRSRFSIDRAQVGATITFAQDHDLAPARMGVARLDKWSELRTVLHVAELGTVSAAAAALGYHRATVNRHIDSLEAEIGARVFLRHAKGYTLTEAGEDVVQVAKTARDLTDDLSGRLLAGKTHIKGKLKLSVLAPFFGLFLGPIGAFKAQHPSCLVEVDTQEAWAKLEHGEAHIAVRAGDKPKHPDYVVQGLGRVRLNLYAHTSYIDRFGLPRDTDDLDGHQFVAPHRKDTRLPFWPWLEAHVRPEQIVISSPDVWVNVEAISRGLGMGFLGDQEAAVRPDLHPVFPPSRLWYVRLWLATHVDLHHTDKVQAMLRVIKLAFETSAKAAPGSQPSGQG